MLRSSAAVISRLLCRSLTTLRPVATVVPRSVRRIPHVAFATATPSAPKASGSAAQLSAKEKELFDALKVIFFMCTFVYVCAFHVDCL